MTACSFTCLCADIQRWSQYVELRGAVFHILFNFIPLRCFGHISVLNRNLFELVCSVEEAGLGKLNKDIDDDIVSDTAMTEKEMMCWY